MSESFSFGLATGLSADELRAAVEVLWSGESVDVDQLGGRRETHRVHLAWYFGTEEEKRQGRSIAAWLLEQSQDERIFFYLDSEGGDNVSDDEPTGSLRVDELFTGSSEPDVQEGYRRHYAVIRGELVKKAPPRLRFLVNPSAGGGSGGQLLDRRQLASVDGGFEVSRCAEHLRELARQAVLDRVRRVVVVGGDGTVHHVLQELVGSETELAVVPCGRGDDFANSLGIPSAVDESLALAISGEAGPVDLLRILGPAVGDGESAVWGGLYASFGFDSRVTEVANAQSRWVPRSLTYILATLRALAGFQAPVIRLEHDSGVYEERSMFVTVCNAPIYGGGMRVAPSASLTDGVLDVVAVRRVSKLSLLRIFPKVFEGRHVDHPAIVTIRCRRARISVDAEVLVGSDGEVEGRAGSEPTEVEVVPTALRVVQPA